MAGKLYCGTSGWNYQDWKGRFYPEDVPQRKWLEFYGRHFDTVEINNSFYRLPEEKTFKTWHDEAPENFIFTVKASRYITHMKKLLNPEAPIELLLSRTKPLAEKHGPILFQLPPYWHVDIARLEAFFQALPKNYRHVFEFRDDTWQIDAVYDMLREYGIGYCIMSAPELPCNLISTADFTYIRMHSGGYENSNYSDESLAWWASKVRGFLDSGDVYIYFNNDFRAYAVNNAFKLKELLAIGR